MSETKSRPFSIRIFLPDGDPDGLRLVEKSNWTGIGVVFSRSIYKDVAQRAEFGKPGVYILVGPSEESALPTIYIGEADVLRNRVAHHHQNKDFWTWAACFTAKDASLNKAHVRYLECLLIEWARDAKQANIENAQDSSEPALTEADRADMNSFLIDMASTFPVLGLTMFAKTGDVYSQNSTPIERSQASVAPGNVKNRIARILTLQGKGLSAKGYEDTEGFVVMKGSQAAGEEMDSLHEHLRILRNDLLQQGVLKPNGESLVLAQG